MVICVLPTLNNLSYTIRYVRFLSMVISGFLIIILIASQHGFAYGKISETQNFIDKGTALQKLGRYEEAIEQYDNVLAIDNNNTDAFYLKGTALQELGYYDEAIDQYDKILAIDKWNNSALYQKGSV